jgi:hypothetical protein
MHLLELGKKISTFICELDHVTSWLHLPGHFATLCRGLSVLDGGIDATFDTRITLAMEWHTCQDLIYSYQPTSFEASKVG